MKAEVSIKTVYGTERIYPENDTAKVLTMLTGCTCLSRQTISLAKQLGIEFEVVQQKI